jgi:hypothetical protein
MNPLDALEPRIEPSELPRALLWAAARGALLGMALSGVALAAVLLLC